MVGEARFGLIEAGGTKFVLGVSDSDGNLIARSEVPTRDPSKTLTSVVDWLTSKSGQFGPFSGVGVASFGPLELDRRKPNWGTITATPKPSWSNVSIVEPLQQAFDCPIAIETDVNAAVKAEWRWGNAVGTRTAIYITVGTGIGGGILLDGECLRGQRHPELGHMRVQRHPEDLDFSGVCPSHGDCLEGLACGPSIIARWGRSLSELPSDHPGRQIIASYLAQAVCNLQAIFEPERIILGGGVCKTPGLISQVASDATNLAGGYFATHAREIIVPPGLEENSGLLGALALIRWST